MANVTPGSFVVPTKVQHQFVQPNFQLMLQSMQANQQFYDQSMARIRETVDALPGDLPGRDEAIAKLEQRAQDITDVYSNQGVNEGQKQLRQAVQDVEKMIRPGGEYFEWKKNLGKHQEFMKNQRERVGKGKITDAQLWASGMRPIQDFKTFNEDGTINDLNLMPREDAINFDKFAGEFLKNKEADLLEQYGQAKTIGGMRTWQKEGLKTIRESDIMDELGSAYRNAVSRTGQLKDEYDYLKYQGNFQDSDILQLTLNEADRGLSETARVIEDLRNNANTAEIQQLLQGLSPEDGAAYMNARNTLLKDLSRQQETLQETFNVMAFASPEEQERMAYQIWEDQTIDNNVSPYAKAKSFQERTVDLKTVRDWDYYWRKKYNFEEWKTQANNKRATQQPFTEATRMEDVKNLHVTQTATDYGLNMSPREFRTKYNSSIKRFTINDQNISGDTLMEFWDEMKQAHGAKSADLVKNDSNPRAMIAMVKAFESYAKDNPSVRINGREIGSLFTETDVTPVVAGYEGDQPVDPLLQPTETYTQAEKFDVAAQWMDAMLSNQKVNFVFDQHLSTDAMDKETDLIIGDSNASTGVWETGRMKDSRIILIEEGEFSRDGFSYDQLTEHLKDNYGGGNIAGGRVLGRTKAANPTGYPTGYYGYIETNDGKKLNVVVTNRSNEEDEYFEPLSKLSVAQYSLKETEYIQIPIQDYDEEGKIFTYQARAKAVPYTFMNEQGEYTTEARVEIHTNNGNVETAMLDDVIRSFEMRNPYLVKEHKENLLRPNNP